MLTNRTHRAAAVAMSCLAMAVSAPIPGDAAHDAPKSDLMMFTLDSVAIVQADPWKARLDLIERAVERTADTGTLVVAGASHANVLAAPGGVAVGQASASRGATPLEGTHWRAIELAGRPAPGQDPQREAHLRFHPGGRVSGSDGCNRLTGSYQLNGDRVTFDQIVATQMACLDPSGIEGPFRAALNGAARFTIAGDRLELFDAAGTRLAAFAAGPQPSAPASPGLAGTSWQLVEFQGGDDTTLTPDERAKYTIAFEPDGQLTARIDCNRGRGTWKSTGSNQIELGPLALTRAMCPPGSLHDQIVKQWVNIRSYVIQNGHLFLALMADGGIYELEPIARSR